MNDEKIEKLLRGTSSIPAPDDLLETLVSDIRLPRTATYRPPPLQTVSWFKRWMPALSFAAIFLGCLVAIAVQTNMVSGLQQENKAMQTSAATLENLRAQNLEFKRLSNETQDLDRLRRDNDEVKTLRQETAKLQARLGEMKSLQAERQRLLASASVPSASYAKEHDDFLAEAKAKAERIHCVNNLKQIGLALRIWANSNADQLPMDFLSLTNELNNWKILQCPSDKSHTVAGWADVANGNVSYQFLTPGLKQANNPEIITLECPLHHNIALLDGSVQQLNEESMQKIVVIQGRKVLLR